MGHVRALPHTLRTTPAPPGTRIRVTVPGPAGGAWTVTSEGGGWTLAPGRAAESAAHVELDAETAWRLCTRGITPAEARARARTDGDPRLADAVCEIVSVIH